MASAKETFDYPLKFKDELQDDLILKNRRSSLEESQSSVGRLLYQSNPSIKYPSSYESDRFLPATSNVDTSGKRTYTSVEQIVRAKKDNADNLQRVENSNYSTPTNRKFTFNQLPPGGEAMTDQTKYAEFFRWVMNGKSDDMKRSRKLLFWEH